MLDFIKSVLLHNCVLKHNLIEKNQMNIEKYIH